MRVPPAAGALGLEHAVHHRPVNAERHAGHAPVRDIRASGCGEADRLVTVQRCRVHCNLRAGARFPETTSFAQCDASSGVEWAGVRPDANVWLSTRDDKSVSFRRLVHRLTRLARERRKEVEHSVPGRRAGTGAGWSCVRDEQVLRWCHVPGAGWIGSADIERT
jgi:hypothetical protein